MEFPGYFKYTTILLGAILTFYAVIVAKGILIPLSLAMVFSLLLFPLCQRFERALIPRSISAVLCILLMLGIIAGVGYMLGLQIDSISRELPELSVKVDQKLSQVQNYFESQFGIDQSVQSEYFRRSVNNFLQNSSAIYSTTFSITAGILNYLVIVPIGLFFMLYYRSFFKEFLYRLMPRQQHDRLQRVLEQIQQVMQDYILGLFMVICIVAVLNIIGLSVVGIRYAIFFGFLAALLTIIPYIGIFIGSLLPILYALFTTDSLLYPVSIAIIFWLVQVLEGNFITPNIVGNKVQLNPFAAILALLVGGAVWGPAGMILFIPFIAMLKVVFDAVDVLKPYGFLLGVPAEVKNETKTYRDWKVRLSAGFKKIFR
ncbi:AI-2E family transporter [Cesiribacter sp. SM1]|uniref:AI-2E family transporter n=1 Tax=Cesiribacter sp. SM1 TaxID=2861196 RepID=UPI001CD3D358|nr:AI-2E family transporter [Cesiribacter sp. SM1]